MKCRYCGCTDGHACPGGCAWAQKDVCTNCVLTSHNIKAAAEAYYSDPDNEMVELIITPKKGKKKIGFLFKK